MSETAKTSHSPIGASSAYRWMACPGSVQASKLHTSQTSVYAAEGTAAHQIAEYYLTNHKRPDGYWVGEVIEIDDHKIKVTEDMETYVGAYIEILAHDLHSADKTWEDLVIEAPLSLEHIHKDAWGTADAYFSDLYCLRVYDLKYGRGVDVAAENNPQLKYYALGAYYALDEFYRDEIAEVEVNIIQPRVQESHKKARFSVEELMEFEKDLKVAIAKTELHPDKLEFVSGGHCRFCPAKPTCTEHRLGLNNITKKNFEALACKDIKEPQQLPEESLVALFEAQDFIISYLESVSNYLLTKAMNGEPPKGYKLVAHTPRSNREWLDEKEAYKTVIQTLGQEAVVTKLKSPSQVEKMLQKLKDKSVVGKIKKLWHKPEKQPVLVLEKEDSEKPDYKPFDSKTSFLQYKEI